MLPAITASPSRLASGTDSPVSSDSSASVRPSISTPSAAKACPTGTRTASPARSSAASISSTPPSPRRRNTRSGRRAVAASSAASARCRARISSQRPPSRKATNIVSESKYTSWPNGPPGSNAAPLLATNATAMPSDTGTSMPMRRWRSERHAPLKNGAAAKPSTGSVSSQPATDSKRCRSGASSPGALT